MSRSLRYLVDKQLTIDRQKIDKMVINDRENIDVYLNLFPLKWSYTIATASKKALASERNTSETSLPISISKCSLEEKGRGTSIRGKYYAEHSDRLFPMAFGNSEIVTESLILSDLAALRDG